MTPARAPEVVVWASNFCQAHTVTSKSTNTERSGQTLIESTPGDSVSARIHKNHMIPLPRLEGAFLCASHRAINVPFVSADIGKNRNFLPFGGDASVRA